MNKPKSKHETWFQIGYSDALDGKEISPISLDSSLGIAYHRGYIEGISICYGREDITVSLDLQPFMV